MEDNYQCYVCGRDILEDGECENDYEENDFYFDFPLCVCSACGCKF